MKYYNRKKIRRIEIIGRRWFQRSYGNTYFTARILINDELAAELPKQYGYGDHYVDVATQWLEDNGYMPGRVHHENGSAEPGWQYWRDNRNVPFLYHAIDVARERDL